MSADGPRLHVGIYENSTLDISSRIISHDMQQTERITIREGSRKKNRKKFSDLLNQGEVSKGSKKLNLYFGKVFFFS